MQGRTTIERYKGKTFIGATGATVTTPFISKRASKIKLSSHKLAYKQAKNMLGGENDAVAREYLSLFTKEGNPKARTIRTTKQRIDFNEQTERIRQLRKKEIEEQKREKERKKREKEILDKLTNSENGLKEEEAQDFLNIIENEYDSIYNNLWYELYKTLDRGGDENASDNATMIYDIMVEKTKSKVSFLRNLMKYHEKGSETYALLLDELNTLKSDLGIIVDNVTKDFSLDEIIKMTDKIIE